jgi:hypothetical protein
LPAPGIEPGDRMVIAAADNLKPDSMASRLRRRRTALFAR